MRFLFGRSVRVERVQKPLQSYCWFFVCAEEKGMGEKVRLASSSEDVAKTIFCHQYAHK